MKKLYIILLLISVITASYLFLNRISENRHLLGSGEIIDITEGQTHSIPATPKYTLHLRGEFPEFRGQVFVSVFPDTVIQSTTGDIISISELEVGQRVTVWFDSGFVLPAYPHRVAKKIKVINK